MSVQQIEVIPGIFEKDFEKIKERVQLVSRFVDWIQIDIADNKFVPNSSYLTYESFRDLIFSSGKKFELHMMIENPLLVIEKWIDVGFTRLIPHIETISDLSNFKAQILQIKSKHPSIEIGLAVDKDTEVETIFPYVDCIDCVLVMTIKSGFSGQKFTPELLEKVKKLKSKYVDLPIEVDGGITNESSPHAIQAGATRLVSTSYIFNSLNLKKAIWTLKNSNA
jgi:ribulose-phosphate 3-epimerase